MEKYLFSNLINIVVPGFFFFHVSGTKQEM